MLLLQNFGRSENSEVLEIALEKIKEKFDEKESEVNELRKANEELA